MDIIRWMHCCLIAASIWTAVSQNRANLCESKESCGKCILAGFRPACVWCGDETPTFSGPRCGTQKALLEKGCASGHISIAENKVLVTVDKELSRETTATEKDAVQIKPQRIRMKLRPRTSSTVSVSFKQAVDYPVDLYYVMDLSQTMRDDKETLGKVGDELASKMRSITKNFQLGFGSFVDKTVLPFASTLPEKLLEPCKNCAPPYGFRNHMPLSVNTSSFSAKVNSTLISGNIDGPEGGLDALMQAMVCKDQINWRDNATKLLLYVTDAGFHLAGDGRLGGIVQPNDEECHLEDGLYTASTTHDYPSINQISVQAAKNKVHIIFAVTQRVRKLYELLSKSVALSRVAVLKSDSSNIVTLVGEQYKAISSELNLFHSADAAVDIEYASYCNDDRRARKLQKGSSLTCNKLKMGKRVDFNVTVKAKECPTVGRNQIISINTVRFKESLIIDLEIDCDCDCEKNGHKNSPKCSNGKGTHECGVCTCNSGFLGDKCQCDARRPGVQTSDACIRDNKTCSGHGDCICGTCVCHRPDMRSNQASQYSGKFCECDNLSCNRHDGLICGGADRGKCQCGVCECSGKYNGTACECSEEKCVDPGSGVACSGRGNCSCGLCECQDSYYGRYCHQCSDCQRQTCDKLTRLVANRDPREQVLANSSISISYEDELELDKQQDERECSLIDKDGCTIFFKYRYETDDDGVSSKRQVVTVLKEKKCPQPFNVERAALTTVSTVLAIGILTLLLWKVCTHCHDKIEYEKFEKERQKANWQAGENPIFKSSTSTFANPAYRSE